MKIVIFLITVILGLGFLLKGINTGNKLGDRAITTYDLNADQQVFASQCIFSLQVSEFKINKASRKDMSCSCIATNLEKGHLSYDAMSKFMSASFWALKDGTDQASADRRYKRVKTTLGMNGRDLMRQRKNFESTVKLCSNV